jgi:hypothetical protein
LVLLSVRGSASKICTDTSLPQANSLADYMHSRRVELASRTELKPTFNLFIVYDDSIRSVMFKIAQWFSFLSLDVLIVHNARLS